MSLRRLAVPALLVAGALSLTACAADASPDAEASEASLEVLASFYPLQYVTEQVGGELVSVSSLTPPGAEPHDLELSPRLVREVGDADVVVHLSGLQPAVDEAVTARAPVHVVDAAGTAAVAAHLEGGEHQEDAEHLEDAEHAEADHAEGDGHNHGESDPHFWLDPALLVAVGQDVADALTAADPDNAETYTAGAEALEADLTALDAAYSDGLAQCERRVIVTSHAAFGFLAERYDLEQVGISGLDPESEPSPARLREIREVVQEHDVTTLFTEVLVNPKVAETLAADLGMTTAVLDPVESQADPATDYRGVMEQNLAALREALGCT